MSKVRVKLVTIIASSEVQDRIERELFELGASGFTVFRVDGRGKHGSRRHGLLDSGNVRFETIVAPAVAEAILERVDQEAETTRAVAYAVDVDAVPGPHFA